MNNETNNENRTGNEREIIVKEIVKIGTVATLGAVKQLADINVHAVSIGAGLLFGRKAGVKTMCTIVGMGSIWNTARYITGDMKSKNKSED